MKRRDVLKGAAVAAGAAVVGLPAVAEGKTLPLKETVYSGKSRRMQTKLYIYPEGPDMKLGPRFQELIEEWERDSRGMRAVEAVTFEPQMEDGEPWLVHSAWEPISKDNLSTLFTEGRNVFRERRWDIIDRAINLREMGYWRQEYGPQFVGMTSGGGMSPGTAHYRMFLRVARKRLFRVVVSFEAIPLSELRRFLGATAPEYARLEQLETAALNA